ncbi:hypothetical protein WMF27_20300 [Sorangium sp. So ce281]|uniref:hypothetical protein n=1 Tax=unclassified Sorangium TaxID=2621164 RepID=UPI003F602180
MSSKQPPPHVTAAHAAGLAALLGATDAAAENERAGSAERHFERSRGVRSARPGPRAKPAAGPLPSPPGGRSNAGGAREYAHAAPTRSPVLNAFLSELGTEGEALVPANVYVFDEHTLAPRLVELARQRVVSMLLAVGRTEVALTLAQMPQITNERAARLFMRQAVHVGGDLGAITGDYARHYRRSGAPERDDQRAGCIMAAFAGRLSAMAEKLLGPHVRAELRAALEALTSQGSPPARRARASDLRAPHGAGRGAPATAARDAASSATRPRRK